MMSQIGQKLYPYAVPILMVHIILICLVILFGGFLILRRIIKKQPFEAGPDFDRERISMEIDIEIARLRALRQRIFASTEDPTSTGLTSGVQTQSVPVTPTEVQASNEKQTVSAAIIDPAQVAEMQRYKEQVQTMFDELSRLKTDLKTKDEKISKFESEAPAANTGSDKQVEELRQVHQQMNAEKEELLQKLTKLEKALAEYEIFEQDLALVKKYKTENEVLKKQLGEGKQLTESDIDQLFKEGTPDEAASIDGEHFFDNAFSSMSSPPVESPPPPKAEPAPTQTKVEKEVPKAAAAPVATTQTATTAAAIAGAAPVSLDGFEFEKMKGEPSVKTDSADVEALAESAVNDDKLIEEFQKILGDQGS